MRRSLRAGRGLGVVGVCTVLGGLGAAEDPPGKLGLAHLVEHLMFEVVLVSGQPADTVAALATAGVTGAQAVADGGGP